VTGLRTRVAAVMAAFLAVGLAASACGRGSPSGAASHVAEVGTDLAPATLEPGYTLSEFPKARAELARVGPKALIGDARLWQIMRGDILVGTLQISAVKPKVRLDHRQQRTRILNGVIPGASVSLQMQGFSVATSKIGQQILYVWFGAGTFEVVQLKGKDLKPEEILQQIVGFQTAHGLHPLPEGGIAT
jgi:hypothetical protein